MPKKVNRVLLGLAGLVLLALGGGVLATGLGMSLPSWWPFDGPGDVLLSEADRTRWRDDGWWWPVVIAILAVLVLLALWWLLTQLRRARLAEVLVDSGDGEGAVLRGRALEGVLTAEAEALDGVERARVTLTGERSAPKARIALVLAPDAEPARTLADLTHGALAHARDSAGLAQLPAEVRLREVKHGTQRVN
ncbi:alkaline shock response membrane anchor protein AmaP [Streptomyces hypolithicus]